MAALRRFLLRLYRLVRRGDADRDLSKEIHSHLTLMEDEFRRRGMTPAAAARAARLALGSVEEVKEMQRDARSFLWIEDLRRDLGYGARALARTRGFTIAAILTLAVGIGAVTIIYSVVRNIVLDPFPYSRSDRLVNVVLRDESGRPLRGAPYYRASEFLDYQEQTNAFEDVVGTSRDAAYWVSEAGTERLDIAWMTPNGFDFLGVPPLAGRVFGAADAAPGAPPVAVMGYRAWIRLFGADPGVLGRTLMLDGKPWTVVGVMPPRFEWNIADLWLCAPLTRGDDTRSPRTIRAFQAHLRPGVTPEEAESQLNVIAARRAAAFPDDYPPRSHFDVLAVVDWVVGPFRAVLYTLFGAVSLLLVIACCNVANMLLARATIREREISIRLAIGASRGRIVRQLLVESALLATGGLVAGCALAFWGTGALRRFMGIGAIAPWETEVRLDQPVLIFAAIAAAVATMTFGLYPALQSVRSDIAARAGAPGRSTGLPQQKRMRSSLVVAQVALSVVLLLGAGLLMRSFVKLVGVDLGFNPSNLLVVPVGYPPRQDPSAEAHGRFYRETLEQLRTIPGVRTGAIANVTPPFGSLSSPIESVAGAAPPQSSALVVFCSEGLIDTLGAPLIRGRQLSALDVEQSHHVALVNETLAKRYFSEREPLGRAIRLPRLTTLPVPVPDPTFEIVGIVRDVANSGPRGPTLPQVYLPFAFRGPSGLMFVLRTSTDPHRLVNVVRERIHATDRQVAILEPSTLEEGMKRAFYTRPRFSLLILGIFACAGILLVAFGVYGVLAYTVSEQTREIAIRMALGGERGHMIRMVVRAGLQLVGIGLLIGVGASVFTNRLLLSELWNTSPTDPAAFAGAASIIVAVGALACWIPARRAVRVEPASALRHE